MTPVEVGVIGIVGLIVLLILRVPVGASMIIVSAVGNVLLTSWEPAMLKVGSDLVRVAQNQTLSVVPLFILMGIFLSKAHLGSALFDLGTWFLGRLRGGMAIATLAASAMFGAICGSVVAAASTLATVCIPEMSRHKYDEGFACGVTAVGAAMGSVIPPSAAMIVYGFLTEESISQVLMAGFIPGILVTVLLMCTVPIVIKFKPHVAPPAIKEKTPFPMGALKIVWGVPVIFLLVFGGIYLGWTTTTEAGAIGAFSSLVFILIMRQMTISSFFDSIVTAVKITGSTFLMLIGGSLFGVFMTRSMIPVSLTNFVSGLDVSPFMIVMFFLLVYTAMGPIMDEMATLIIMTPIVYPIIISLGYNGVWFGIMSIMMLMTGLLTPPVGLVSLVTAAVAKVPAMRVFSSQWPFWLTMILGCVIIALFPQITLFLPNAMLGR